MKHISLILGVLLASAPLALLISGCGSGNGGGLLGGQTATPTATSTATSTATPTPTATTQQTSNITLGNGQRAILRTSTASSGAITGTLQILAPAPDARKKTKALTVSIRVGTFRVTGTFTPPRGYDIRVFDGNTELLSMSGLFPTATQTGTYTLRFNGQTESGTIPVIGTAFPTPTPGSGPTATPAPTATPVPTSSGQIDLSITNGAGSNFGYTTVKTPATGQIHQIAPGLFSYTFFGSISKGTQTNPSDVRSFSLQIIGKGDGLYRVGDRISVMDTTGGTRNVAYTSVTGAFGPTSQSASWGPEGVNVKVGEIEILDIARNRFKVRFIDVVLKPSSASSPAKGTITLNGTVTINPAIVLGQP